MAAKTVISPQKGKQELAFNTKVDFMIYGGARGAGKSHFITMRPLEYIDDPKFRGIFFRREYSELKGEGGLWDTAASMYPLLGGVPNISDMRYRFNTGSALRFSHMYTEKDKESHRGLQYSFIAFDEIDQFSKDQVTFLLTCLRSEAEVDSFCIGTCNPNPDSWLLPIIEWYLDEKGFPREDRCGAIRYFVVINGDFVFGDSEEYFQENYPDSVYVYDPVRDKQIYIPPKTFTFINGNVFDNPALLKSNPRYLSELQNLPDHERDRQLWGNWYARPTGSNYWQRDWIRGMNGERVLHSLPDGLHNSVRAYDKAGSEVSEVYKYPDFTAASPKIYKDTQGYYYLVGDYHPEFKDKDSDIIGRFRKRAGERDSLILEQALLDGDTTTTIFSQDSGQAGQSEFLSSSKQLIENGLVVRKDPVANNKTKLTKFQPFASACENGLVYIVESTFTKATLDALYSELEAFNGERSTAHRKDDWVDGIATAFNAACREKNIPSFTLPDNNSRTPIQDLRQYRT